MNMRRRDDFSDLERFSSKEIITKTKTRFTYLSKGDYPKTVYVYDTMEDKNYVRLVDSFVINSIWEIYQKR